MLRYFLNAEIIYRKLGWCELINATTGTKKAEKSTQNGWPAKNPPKNILQLYAEFKKSNSFSTAD